jgi:SagB-type dehydrogenase family enzyme
VGAAPPAEPGLGARAYHQLTRHTRRSVRESGHTLDWANKPFPFKVYPEAPAVPLDRELAPPVRATLPALVAGPARGDTVSLERLAQCLFFAAGLTRRRAYPGGELHFRAAASTGALYEIEVYVVAGAVAGLEPGVYHFGPGDFALRRLRDADHRAALAAAAGAPDAVRAAPVTLVLSAIYWRNTWKYRARAYRHFFWDSGTLLANLLATAASLDLPARVLLGFADAAVDALLGLDARHETSLVLIPLGADAPPPPSAPATGPVAWTSLPLSRHQRDEPLVRQALTGSALADGAAARAWSAPGPSLAPDALAGSTPPAGPAGRPLGETILRRGSTRRFARVALAEADLAALLAAAVQPLPLDVERGPAPLVDVYLLVHAVTGLEPGAYYRASDGRLELLRAGDFRAEGGYLCLEQALGADASVVVFFLADLAPVLARHGERGYRAVNLAAGLLGGRMYLAAYALGFGATGLTFYDDDVVRFFSPHAAGRDAIFVTALGRSRPA